MFATKKNKNDLAGSTQRFLDARRDPTSRFKHLRFALESYAEPADRKSFVEQYAFEAFHLFHELLCQVDHVTSAPRNVTELEYALWLLEILMCYLPEHVAHRWQFNAIYGTLKKTAHPHNTLGLRRIATRLFVIWYQILSVGSRGADDLDPFFASLVPNLPRHAQTGSPVSSDALLTHLCEQHHVTGVAEATTYFSKRCTPLAPAMPEKSSNAATVSKGLLTQAYMEKLLEAVSTESTKIEWKSNKNERVRQCLRFLLDKIRLYYAQLTYGAQLDSIDITCPKIISSDNVVSRHRNSLGNLPVDEDPLIVCAQCLARWASMYSFSHRKQSDSLNQGDQSFNRLLQQQSPTRQFSADAKLPPNFELMREMFFGSKNTVNFLFTVLREGFLLPLTYAGTMGRVFKVLREWLTTANDDAEVDHLPPFFKESSVGKFSSPPSPSNATTTFSVGLQKSLQTIVTVLASFYSNPYLYDEHDRLNLIIQISNRVLTLFKLLANSNGSSNYHNNNNRFLLTLDTWAFVLKVLLNVIRNCLPKTPPVGIEYPLSHRVAPQLYQTLLVTWVFAGLNSVISAEMWDDLLSAMSERTSWTSLINEWSKVMESVTRALGLQIYNVDLLDLPLERMSEQNMKKMRGKMGEALSATKSSANDNNHTKLDSQATSATGGKDLAASYNFVNVSPSGISTANGPSRPSRKQHTPEMKHPVGGATASVRQHQQLARVQQKSTDVIGNSPIDIEAAGGSEVSSLDGSNSLDGCRAESVNANDNATGGDSNVINDNNGTLLEGDILASTPLMPSLGDDDDCDNDSEEFVVTDDNASSSGGAGHALYDDDHVFGAPETIAIIWRRMLACLGDINQIQDTDIHLTCLEVIQKIADMLLKINENQNVPPADGAAHTVYPPNLVSPYLVFTPWLLTALSLPERYHRSKLLAVSLLCKLIIRYHDVPMEETVLCKFYLAVLSVLNSNDTELTLSLYKFGGPKLLYMPNTDCMEFLLYDYVYVATTMLNLHTSSLNLHNRSVLINALSCVINLPQIYEKKSFYRFTLDDQQQSKVALSAQELQNSILDCLCRNISNGYGHVITIQSLKALTIYLHSCLMRKRSIVSFVPYVNFLLSSLSIGGSNAENGYSICQLFFCLLDVIPGENNVYLNLHIKIIYSIIGALENNMLGELNTNQNPNVYTQTNIITRLLFDLIDWCLRLPKNLLNNSTNLNTIVEVDESESESIKSVLESTIQALVNMTHNQSLPITCRNLALSLIDLLIRFFDQYFTHPCCISEWDATCREDSSSENSCIFFKYRRNCALSIYANSSDHNSVRFLCRQTVGKDCADSCRVRNSSTQASLDVNRWLSDKNLRVERKTSTRSGTVVIKQAETARLDKTKMTLPSFETSDNGSLERLLIFLQQSSPECFISYSGVSAENDEDEDNGRVDSIIMAINHLQLKPKTGNFSIEVPEHETSLLDSFNSCRLFLDANLNPVWESCRRVHCSTDYRSIVDQLQRDLKHVDSVFTRETHKIAVIYVGEGREEKQSILKCDRGSIMFEQFVAALGVEIDLKQHYGMYSGGLLTTDACTTVYYATPTLEAVYHVSTRSLGATSGGGEANLNTKLRHIGNDEVHIVWSEHWRDYRRSIIPTQFCDVLITVYPLPDTNMQIFRVHVDKKSNVPEFGGPLFDGVLVEWSALPSLIRATAVNASRAKRLSQECRNFLEHRYQTLQETLSKYCTPQTSSYSSLLTSLLTVGVGKRVF